MVPSNGQLTQILVLEVGCCHTNAYICGGGFRTGQQAEAGGVSSRVLGKVLVALSLRVDIMRPANDLVSGLCCEPSLPLNFDMNVPWPSP